MDSFLAALWNFLWEYQLWIVFLIALVIWIGLKLYDLIRWIIRKSKEKANANPH